MKPTFGSAFAGIGGFELGLERVGWECKWQIENDKSCNEILERHWPNVKRYGGIEEVNPKELEAVDLICGGFPCQDLSVAGKRGGLSGERSGLFWELVRLARELQPRWLLVENVSGFLSSNEGEDFALALETLAECGYGLAWRVLDSQYFGVPQRRRRVFIVGHLGAMCPPEILFESEGGEGDIAEGGKAGEDVAYSLGGRIKKGGEPWRHEKGRETLVTGAVSSKWAKQCGGPAGDEAYNLICEETDPDGVREASGVPRRVDLPVPVAFDWRSGGDVRLNISKERVSPLHSAQAPAVMTEEQAGKEMMRRIKHCFMCPDSPRYRALGNAVTVQVAEWIGRRILEYYAKDRYRLQHEQAQGLQHRPGQTRLLGPLRRGDIPSARHP